MTLNIYEGAQAANHSSQPTPMPPNSTEHVLVKPESPPPPYVTPPGTVPRNFDYSLVMDLPGPSTYKIHTNKILTIELVKIIQNYRRKRIAISKIIGS